MPDVQDPMERPLSITMTANEWNVALDGMSYGQYRLVGPVIAKIHEQARAAAQQFEQQQQPQAPRLVPAE